MMLIIVVMQQNSMQTSTLQLLGCLLKMAERIEVMEIISQDRHELLQTIMLSFVQSLVCYYDSMWLLSVDSYS